MQLAFTKREIQIIVSSFGEAESNLQDHNKTLNKEALELLNRLEEILKRLGDDLSKDVNIGKKL